MNPIAFAMRRPFTTLMLVVVLVGFGVLGLAEMKADTGTPGNQSKISTYLNYIGEKARQAKGYVAGRLEGKTGEHAEGHGGEGEAHHVAHKIIATSPEIRDVMTTQPYVCQIHSRRHIEVCALESGYLEEISVREGQTVKKGDPLFKILSTLYQANLDAENAEAELAQLEYNNTQQLASQNVVSERAVALLKAKLNKAKANAELAQAEVNFTKLTAPFDGIVDKLLEREGSLIEEGDVLTTLSDNSVMWVYFNVPEADYLAYMARTEEDRASQKIELQLANHSIFPEPGKIGAIEAKFNNETGNIAFRADFPNPSGLLRHGQTGTVLIHQVVKDAMVIPQRSTFETLAKRYVYVIGEDERVHQHEIKILNELDDIYVIEPTLKTTDEIVLEGTRQLREGDEVEYEFEAPADVKTHFKNKAE